jgi:hypothetical protein
MDLWQHRIVNGTHAGIVTGNTIGIMNIYALLDTRVSRDDAPAGSGKDWNLNVSNVLHDGKNQPVS